MKTIIVSGSREWADEEAFFEAIADEDPDFILHGDCPTGADAMVADLPNAVPLPAQWDKYGNPAGMKRNAAMLQVLLILAEHGHDVAVVAAPLPGGRGTQGMMKIAREAAVRVRIVEDRDSRNGDYRMRTT